MRYQINHPAQHKWEPTNLTMLKDLIKADKLILGPKFIKSSIDRLESTNELIIINLGGFNINFENFAEIDPTIAFLKTL